MTLTPRIAPLNGAESELFPGGPRLSRTGNELWVFLGPDTSRGFLRATYRDNGKLLKVETANPRGKVIAWTHYGDDASVDEYTDLPEAGRASTWTRREPDPKKPDSILIREYRAGKGKWILRSTRSIPGWQSCDSGKIDYPPVVDVVDEITRRFEGKAACPASTPVIPEKTDVEGMQQVKVGNDYFVFYGEDTVKHELRPVGGACVDSSCDAPVENLDALIKTTIQEGAACMAKLGMDRMGSSTDRANAQSALLAVGKGESLSDTNAAYLKKSFALRNAAQLLMLYNQSKNVGATYSSNQQTFLETSVDPNPNATPRYTRKLSIDAEAKARYRATPASPIKLYCADSRVRITALDREQSEFNYHYRGVDGERSLLSVDGSDKAIATLPGLPGWPVVRLRPGHFGSIGPEPTETQKAILFHELLHNLGFTHGDDPGKPYAGGTQTSLPGNWDPSHESGGETVPVHTACQVCCFPEGFKSLQPTEKLETECRTEVRQEACDFCSGKNGTTRSDTSTSDYKTKKSRYIRDVKFCYQNGNPE